MRETASVRGHKDSSTQEAATPATVSAVVSSGTRSDFKSIFQRDMPFILDYTKLAGA